MFLRLIYYLLWLVASDLFFIFFDKGASFQPFFKSKIKNVKIF